MSTALATDPRLAIGANNPPGPIDYAKEAVSQLNGFLAENPVIETPETAKQAGGYVERTSSVLAEMEDARTLVTRPLNAKLSEINDLYRTAKKPLEKLLNELRFRLTDFAGREEAKRIAQAEALRREAELVEMEARVAERREGEAIEAVRSGVCDVNLADAMGEATQAFADYSRADRIAQRAERGVPVRIASQMGGRALSMRSKEVLILDDAAAAVGAMGLTEKISEAILSSARDYRKTHKELPAGVRAETERTI